VIVMICEGDRSQRQADRCKEDWCCEAQADCIPANCVGSVARFKDTGDHNHFPHC
jgi:hypothetical protein